MKQFHGRAILARAFLAPALLGLALTGCVSTGMWSEAPRDDYYYNSGAPVSWWGSNVGSVDVFYGALAGYGRWDIYPGYGRVFIPSGVGPGWQPYSRGYWMNDPRYGRRWVSSEPFGWATYHYGRWGRDSRLGWFWVPDTRFGPSWVDWRSSGGYDSWAPLPPIGWSRYARSGYGWGNDWWLHAPSAYAWGPGYQQHVRRGRPDGVATRPGTNQPAPGIERPRRDDATDGRHPRSDGWQRGDRSRPDQMRDGRHPRSAPGAGIGTRAEGNEAGVRGGDGRQMRGNAGRTEAVRTAPPRGQARSAPQAGQAPQQVQVRSAPQQGQVRAAPQQGQVRAAPQQGQVRAAPQQRAEPRAAPARPPSRSSEPAVSTNPE